MRLQMGVACLTVPAAIGFAALALCHGQERAPAPPGPPAAAVPAAPLAAAPPDVARPHDFPHYTELQKDMLLVARRGAEWLFRMNQPRGRFVHGWTPSLPDVVPEGDSTLRQAGAAFALARAARFFNEDRYTARAAQSVLSLLDETVLDPPTLPSPSEGEGRVGGQVRCPTAPNRLGVAALLVLTINELPDPQSDLIDASEQLCNYIRKQARPDGSLAGADESAAAGEHAGAALYALMRSQVHRPADWKTDLVRKAVAYYRPWWPAHQSMEFVPWMTAACWEAYQRTKEKAFADFVFEMNDWLVGLQYNQLDPQRQLWFGGFRTWSDGKALDTAPTVGTAFYAEGLADACRTARQAVDVDRYGRYAAAVQLGLQFTARLQYTEAGCSHFAEWYRPRLVGGFHASHQDGDLRIDYNQHAVSALLQFLDADLK